MITPWAILWLLSSSWAAITKTGWLKPQKCVFLELWRLAVWDQGTNTAGFWWGFVSQLADCLSLCAHVTLPRAFQRGREPALWLVLSWGHRSLMSPLPSWPHLTPVTPQRPHLQTPSHWELGLHRRTWQRQGDIRLLFLEIPKPIWNIALVGTKFGSG